MNLSEEPSRSNLNGNGRMGALLRDRSVEIFRLLGNGDALEIFKQCKLGIGKHDRQIIQQLSKKRYYSRLKRLREYGLIVRDNDQYVHTTFGSRVFTIVSLLDQ